MCKNWKHKLTVKRKTNNATVIYLYFLKDTITSIHNIDMPSIINANAFIKSEVAAATTHTKAAKSIGRLKIFIFKTD